MNKPQSWPDCDKAVYRYITGFINLLKKELHTNLAGVYLHGSLAMGSYFPPKSDMDFIIVSKDNIDEMLAKELNTSIARYSEIRPTAGDIECSVITLNTALNAPDEMPYELHYSEAWHDRILDNQVVYGIRQIDPDLPAHLMCVKKRGVCLYGMEIGDVFGEISWRNFVLAIMDDFNWITEGENIYESPCYGVLNICRVLQILTYNNERYLSKYEGATWGIENLPSEYTPLIQKALVVYSSAAPIAEGERRTGGVAWDKNSLLGFRDFAVTRRAAVLKNEAHL